LTFAAGTGCHRQSIGFKLPAAPAILRASRRVEPPARRHARVLTKNTNGVDSKNKNDTSADFGAIWQMTLNGVDYTVTGSNRLGTDPFSFPYGFPIPNSGMVLGTGTGTVHKPFFTNWPAVVVGPFSCTWLCDQLQDGSFDDVATCTISLYE